MIFFCDNFNFISGLLISFFLFMLLRKRGKIDNFFIFVSFFLIAIVYIVGINVFQPKQYEGSYYKTIGNTQFNKTLK